MKATVTLTKNGGTVEFTYTFQNGADVIPYPAAKVLIELDTWEHPAIEVTAVQAYIEGTIKDLIVLAALQYRADQEKAPATKDDLPF